MGNPAVTGGNRFGADMRSRWFNYTGVVLVGAACVGATLVMAELVFRAFLFSGVRFMSSLREPARYANEYSTDYFKLQNVFTEKWMNPSDPVMGWIDRDKILSAESGGFRHLDDALVRDRTPVLLYGDSFTRCHTPRDECFEGLLNRNEKFSGRQFALNYGVSGYSIGQIYLLYQKTVGRYRSPIVIIGILNHDLDRALAPATWGLQPYFSVENGLLVCKRDHLSMTAEEFARADGPEIRSYLWRLAVHSDICPARLSDRLCSAEDHKARVKEVSGKILSEMVSDLRKRNIRCLFVIFEWSKRMIRPPDWRVEFLVQALRSSGVDYILARDLIVGKTRSSAFQYTDYAIIKDGHPNRLYNERIAEAILQWVSKNGNSWKER